MPPDNADREAPQLAPHKLTAETGIYALKGSSVALILNSTGRIEVNDFKGSAEARINDDGTLAVSIQGGPKRGRSNENSVLKILRNAVAAQCSCEVAISDGVDSRGEDGLLQVASSSYVVQIVTVPVDQEYGRMIASGNFRISLTTDIAVEWINRAIVHKLGISNADRTRTILALDVRHVAILTDERVLHEFKSRYPDTDKHGFAQIWLVGPITARSARLA